MFCLQSYQKLGIARNEMEFKQLLNVRKFEYIE